LFFPDIARSLSQLTTGIQTDSGIGVGIAKNLASKGADIVITYTSNSSTSLAADLVKELTTVYNVHALSVQADLGTTNGAQSIVAAVKEAFAARGRSDVRIDIVVHNAGVAHNNPLSKITLDEFDRSYNVNVRGPLLLMQAVEPYLPHDRSGRVVCVSSVSSTCGFPCQTVYGGTKAALEAMARTWARELAERATVNSINPGPVATEMWFRNTPEVNEGIRPFSQHTPLMRVRPGIDPQDMVDGAKASGGRPATVDEIAGVVGMLCTPDAAWITGQVVCANGGFIFGTQ